MDILRSSQKKPSFVDTFLYSLFFHFFTVSLLLFIPLYSGGASYGSFGGYFVYLNDENPAVKTGQTQITGGAGTDNVPGTSGDSETPLEDHAQSGALQLDKEGTPFEKQEGRGAEVAGVSVVQGISEASPEGSGRNTAPEENKKKLSQKIPEAATVPYLFFSEEKSLKDHLPADQSSEMTPTSGETDTPAQASEKRDMSDSPPLQTKNPENNGARMADRVILKQNAEISGKTEQLNTIAIPGKASVKKKGESEEASEELLKEDHPLAKGNDKTSMAKDSNSDVGGSQTALHAGPSVNEGKPGPKKNAGADKTVENFSAQATQKKPVVPAGPTNELLKQSYSTKFDLDTKSQERFADATRSKAAAPANPEKETGKNRIGISVSEALIQKDIKIELVLKSAEMPEVLTQLFRKPHPKLRRRSDRERQETIEGTVETRVSEAADMTVRRVFAVTKAEEGVYTLVLENKDKTALTMGVIFRFYEGRGKKFKKEYKNRELQPGERLRFLFIMPEAFFWDDEDRFSGSVEDSRSITKFHYESGLVWKEEK